jgi:hypothetical protein
MAAHNTPSDKYGNRKSHRNRRHHLGICRQSSNASSTDTYSK